MFSFWKRRTKPDSRGLEQVIYDIAELDKERIAYVLTHAGTDPGAASDCGGD
jgi:hypothetical protein